LASKSKYLARNNKSWIGKTARSNRIVSTISIEDLFASRYFLPGTFPPHVNYAMGNVTVAVENADGTGGAACLIQRHDQRRLACQGADSDECGHPFRLKAASDSD
jgi:hypothetical protein